MTIDLGCLLCDRVRFRRGLCCGCYKKACSLIRDGGTTWEKEILRGRALEAKKGRAPWYDYSLRNPRK